jgi:cobaltochelatase CobS
MLRVFLMGLAMKDTMLITGHSGTGKSSVISQIGARLNYNVVTVNYDGSLGRGDLLGEWIVLGGEMQFKYGIIPTSFQLPGTIILLDEWDAQNKDAAYVLQRPLQRDDRKLHLLETNELIELHPDNVLAATGNTAGMGDDTGLYSQAIQTQSFAQINRFSLTFRMTYLTEAEELKLLTGMFPGIEERLLTSMIQIANKLRDAYAKGTMSVPFTTRDIINWVEKYILLGEVLLAATYCFLNRMTEEDGKVASGLITRVFAV